MCLPGFFGFYVGGNAQLLREIPFNAIQMALFTTFKDKWAVISTTELPAIGGIHDPTVVAAGIGLMASTIAALLTQPADVIKTKLMTGMTSSSAGNCV